MKGFSVQNIVRIVSIMILVAFSFTPTHVTHAIDCPPGQYCVLAPIPNFEGPITSTFKLGDYVVGIFKVGIGLAGVLAVIMLIMAGISYMMSELVGSKEEAKSQMGNAVFGLLLALGAYTILNTINPDILCLRFLGSDCAQGGGQQQQNNGGNNGNNGGNQNNGGGNVTPPPPPGPGGTGVTGTIAGIEADANDGTIDNSCDSRLPTQGCGTAGSCQQYVNMINTVAGNDVELRKVMKAIMAVESSCNIGAGSDQGGCGLFQFIEQTANSYRSGCTTATTDCAWLQNPNNAQASACIAKNFLLDLRQNANNDGRWRNVLASYNGTITGVTPSNNCEGNMVSCLNGSNIKQWECPWDDDAHTDHNEGFAETRNYVPEVSYCLIHPEAWTGETSFNP